MNALQVTYEFTLSIHALLFNKENEVNRTYLIEKVNELLDQREASIKELSPPYSAEELQIGQEMIQLDKVIHERLDELLGEIQKDIKKFKERKSQSESYINPYGKIKTTDGMYLDSKQ